MKLKTSLAAVLAATIALGGVPTGISHNAPGQNVTVEAAFKSFKGTTTTTLNVREGAGTKYKKVGSLKEKTTITVIGSKSGWYQIKFNGKNAYVSAKYVKKQDTPVSTFKKFDVKTTDNLNVRSTRSAKGKKLGQLAKGSKVTVLGSQSGWYTINFKGKTGYISAKYTTKVSTAPTVKYQATVAVTKSDVRSGASTKHKVIGSLKKGSKVAVYGTSNEYSKILYKNSYSYVKSSDLKKVTTPATPTTPTSPSKTEIAKPDNVKGYELQTGSMALALNFDNIEKVKISNSFNHQIKVNEMNELASNIGAKGEGSGLNLVNTVEGFESLDDVKIAYDFAYGNNKFKMYYSSGRDLRIKESKYLMKVMLKPYLPKGYETVANKYFDGQYYGGGGYGPFNVDGYKVTFNAGSIRFEK